MTHTAPARDAERRAFLRLLAATTAALAMGGCTKQPVGLDQAPTPPVVTTPPPIIPPTPGVNAPPVWQVVPTITFAQGVASSIGIGGYVSDANGDSLTIAMNAAVLPAGVTYDAPNKRFVYDGVGAIASTSGVVLIANDGKG